MAPLEQARVTEPRGRIVQEVEALLRLARDRSAESRQRLVATISDLFFGKETVLTAQERALTTDILRKLIREVAMPVRRALAERLAAESEPPREVLLALARDDIEVAGPILLRSPALLDIELVEIIRQRSLDHQLAIAMRRSLSESVSEALVETGQSDVIRALLENADAEISEATLAYLVDQSKTLDGFQEPILRRHDLSPELARKMYLWVSAALRQHIIESFDIDVTALDDAIEAAAKEAIARMGGGDRQAADKPLGLARRLAVAGQITPQLLVSALRQGEIALFEALLCQLSGLRLRLIRRLLFEPGGEGLAVICRAVGIEKPVFASIFLLSRRARPDDQARSPPELSRVLAFFDRTDPAAAQAVVARWRHDPEYLHALKVLEEAKGDIAPF